MHTSSGSSTLNWPHVTFTEREARNTLWKQPAMALDGVLDVPGRLEIHVQAVVVLGPVDGAQQVKHLRGS